MQKRAESGHQIISAQLRDYSCAIRLRGKSNSILSYPLNRSTNIRESLIIIYARQRKKQIEDENRATDFLTRRFVEDKHAACKTIKHLSDYGNIS